MPLATSAPLRVTSFACPYGLYLCLRIQGIDGLRLAHRLNLPHSEPLVVQEHCEPGVDGFPVLEQRPTRPPNIVGPELRLDCALAGGRFFRLLEKLSLKHCKNRKMGGLLIAVFAVAEWELSGKPKK
jgi:hypothetical protein